MNFLSKHHAKTIQNIIVINVVYMVVSNLAENKSNSGFSSSNKFAVFII